MEKHVPNNQPNEQTQQKESTKSTANGLLIFELKCNMDPVVGKASANADAEMWHQELSENRGCHQCVPFLWEKIRKLLRIMIINHRDFGVSPFSDRPTLSNHHGFTCRPCHGCDPLSDWEDQGFRWLWNLKIEALRWMHG